MGQRLSGKGGKDESLVSLSIGGKRNEACVCVVRPACSVFGIHSETTIPTSGHVATSIRPESLSYID